MMTDLRARQAPLKQQYRDDAAAALIRLKAEGRVGAAQSCSVSAGQALIDAGLHPATGGPGQQACSGDMLLQALVACAGVTLSAVATSLGMSLADTRVSAEGDLDVRGTLGVDKTAPVGFREIRLAFAFAEPLGREEAAKLLQLTERYCVVYQTLMNGVAMVVTSNIVQAP